MVNSGAQPTIWDKLQRIDRRILYLVLLIVVGIPTLYPIRIPSPVTPMVMAPGRSLANATSSRAESIFIEAFTTSMVELNTAMPTGAKSLTGS